MTSPPVPAGAPPVNPDRRLRQLLLPVYLPHLMMSIAIALTIVTLPPWSNELAESDLLAGVAVSMLYVAAVIMNVPAGLLSGRIGLNNTATLGILLFAAGAAVEAFTSNYGLLLAGRFVEGAGVAFWLVSRNSYVAAVTPNQRHGRAGSLFGATFRTGFIIGPLIASLLIAGDGINIPLIGVIISAIVELLQGWTQDPLQVPFLAKIAFAGLAFAVYIPASWGRDVTVPKLYFKDMPSAVKQTVVQNRRNFFLIGILVLIIQSLRTAREFLVTTIGVDIGVELALINILVSASFALDAAIAFSSGVMMDRYGRKAAAVPFLLVTAAAFALLAVTAASGLLAIFIIATLMLGVGNGLSSGIIVTIGADLAPRSHPEEFIGVWRSINDTGGAAGPFLSGLVSSFSSLWGSGAVFAGVALGGLALVWLYIPETLKRIPRPRT